MGSVETNPTPEVDHTPLQLSTQAAEAYQLLDESPEQAIQVVFNHA